MLGLTVLSLGIVLVATSIFRWERPLVGPTAAMPHVVSHPVRPIGRHAPVVPDRVLIPAIGVSAPVVRLGLNPDGTLQVPSVFAEAGWYGGSAVPGSPGPTVIVGHVDSTVGPAVFYRLGDLAPGSVVRLLMGGGARRRFVVTRVAEYPKSAFPTDVVYGSTAAPTLRLITCGGRFDRSTGHYVDNVIVFADLL